MEAAGAEVHARELETRGRKRGRRGVSEPSRLGQTDKRELFDRLESSWTRFARDYFEVAQTRCEAAREWYEEVAHLYTQARDRENILELGPGGHLFDHKYQVTAKFSKLEPEYVRIDNAVTSDSGMGSVFATCVRQLGRMAHHDPEVELRRKVLELEAYCHRLEEHNETLTCKLMEGASGEGSGEVWCL